MTLSPGLRSLPFWILTSDCAHCAPLLCLPFNVVAPRLEGPSDKLRVSLVLHSRDISCPENPIFLSWYVMTAGAVED